MRAEDPQVVVDALQLRTVLPANWFAGLQAEEGVFVTPSIDGWVLAVGDDLRGNGDYARVVPALIERLSAVCGEAAWFVTHDEAEHHGWALARRGQVERAFVWAGDDAEVLWLGEVTAAERDIGCYVDDPRDQSEDGGWWPDDRHVLRIAARWSVDPSRLAAGGRSPSVGCLGRL